MKAQAIPEKAIQKACLDYLAYRGILAWRNNSGAITAEYKGKTRFVRFNSAKGMSDICAVLPDGRFAAIEVKRPGKDATEEQAAFLASVKKSGGVGVVVHSVEELAKAIEEKR